MDYKVSDLKDYVRGLYWFGQEDYELTRFPTSSFPRLREDVAFLATNPSGGRICFRAQASGIGIELEYPPPRLYDRFSRAGQFGVDLYVDGKFFQTYVPQREGYFISFAKTDPSREHSYTLYLPTYAAVKLISLGVEDEEVEIAPPRPFAVGKPVVFYGSSITQGAFADRPGLAYPAIIGRMLNVDIINLGFSGNGKGEPEVADLVTQIDAACFVMDWGANLSAPEEEGLINDRYRPFLQKIKDAHPDTPILLVGTQWFGGDPLNGETRRLFQLIRDEIKATYDAEVAEGNTLIEYVDAQTIIGPNDMDCTADGAHANDFGFARYAEVLAPVLKRILQLDL